MNAVAAPDRQPSLAQFAGLAPGLPQIEALEARLLGMPEINRPEDACPLKHEFAPGVYVRTIYMRAGFFIIGHEHNHEHFNVVHRGRALINYDGEVREIRAPAMFVSAPHVRKMLVILEDMEFSTVHANPDDERDIATLEARYVRPSDSFVEYQEQIARLKERAASL